MGLSPLGKVEIKKNGICHSQGRSPGSTAQYGDVRNLTQELRSKTLLPQQSESTKEVAHVGRDKVCYLRDL